MLTMALVATYAALAATTAHAQTVEPSTPPAATPTTLNQPQDVTRGMIADTGVRIVSPKYSNHDLARAFGFLDTNHDRNISRSEAAPFKNIAKYFDLADTNRNQALSRQEFDTAMNTTRPQ